MIGVRPRRNADLIELSYRFNAKEDQNFTGVPPLDYGARFYNPAHNRWSTPDPLAEKYYGISPYAFCNNNPVNFVDLDGREILPKGTNELLMIKNTIPSDMWKYIQVGENGFIDKNLINSVTLETSSNFSSLQEMVNSSTIVEVDMILSSRKETVDNFNR